MAALFDSIKDECPDCGATTSTALRNVCIAVYRRSGHAQVATIPCAATAASSSSVRANLGLCARTARRTRRHQDGRRPGGRCGGARSVLWVWCSAVFWRRCWSCKNARGRISSVSRNPRTPEAVMNVIPDVRDGLNRMERVVLWQLDVLQKERGGRNVPTAQLYGRVCEILPMSKGQLIATLQRLGAGPTVR